jgi:hypothetical protein
MEMLKSLFTLNEPMGRWDFFLRNVVLIICSVLLISLLPQGKTLGMSLIISVYIALLVVYYVFLITMMKRFWDILSDKTKAIIYGLVVTFVAPFVPVIGAIFSIGAFFFLLFKGGNEV